MWVAQSVEHPTLVFGSGNDLKSHGMEPKPHIGLCTQRKVCSSLSLPLCPVTPSPMCVLSLSLSKWIKTLKRYILALLCSHHFHLSLELFFIFLIQVYFYPHFPDTETDHKSIKCPSRSIKFQSSKHLFSLRHSSCRTMTLKQYRNKQS